MENVQNWKHKNGTSIKWKRNSEKTMRILRALTKKKCIWHRWQSARDTLLADTVKLWIFRVNRMVSRMDDARDRIDAGIFFCRLFFFVLFRREMRLRWLAATAALASTKLVQRINHSGAWIGRKMDLLSCEATRWKAEKFNSRSRLVECAATHRTIK